MKMRAKVSKVEINDTVSAVCIGIFEMCRIARGGVDGYAASMSDLIVLGKTKEEVYQKLLKKLHADSEGMVTVYSTIFGKYTVFDVAGEDLYRVTQLRCSEKKLNTVTVGESDEIYVWRMIGAE